MKESLFSFFMPLTGTDVAGRWNHLYEFLIAMSIVFFLIVVGGMFYFIFKYAKDKVDRPTYITHNNALEAVYIAIPTLLLLGIFVWGFDVYRDMIRSPSNAMEVRGIGKQWAWQFIYDNGRTTNNNLFVPMNRPVKVILSSDDVLHGFFVPNFRVKTDVVPGMYTSVWFEAKVPGRHHLFCTAYCGASHSLMIGEVVVLTDEQWNAWQKGQEIKLADIPDSREWLRAQRSGQPIAESGVANASFVRPTLVDTGKTLFQNKGCVSCHNPGDTGGGAFGASAGVGPSLKGIYGHEQVLTSGQTVAVDENYLRESIEYPNAKIVKGFSPLMPTFKGQLTEQEMSALITYIKSLN